MGCLTNCCYFLFTGVLSAALIGVGVYFFLKEECWPKKYTEEKCIVSISAGGLGSLFVWLSVVIFCVAQCSPSREAKERDEEKAERRLEPPLSNIAQPKESDMPAQGINEVAWTSESHDNLEVKTAAVVVAPKPVADIKTVADIAPSVQQPQAETKLVAPDLVTRSQQTEIEEQIAENVIKPPVNTPIAKTPEKDTAPPVTPMSP
nr:expressed protein [Hymenolepis microstoma]